MLSQIGDCQRIRNLYRCTAIEQLAEVNSFLVIKLLNIQTELRRAVNHTYAWYRPQGKVDEIRQLLCSQDSSQVVEVITERVFERNLFLVYNIY